MWLLCHGMHLPGLAHARTLWAYLDTEQNWGSERSRTLRLWSYFSDLKRFKSKDPRDHVYGVLGLYQRSIAPETNIPRLLYPDYTRPAAEVFRDATRYIISVMKDLRVLTVLHNHPDNAQRPEEPSPPSWAVSLDVDKGKGDPGDFRRGLRCCGRHRHAVVRKHADLNVLAVKGILVDSVARPRLEVDTQLKSPCDHAEAFSYLIEVLRTAGWDDEKAFEMLAMTLVAGSDNRWEPVNADVATKNLKICQMYLRRADWLLAGLDIHGVPRKTPGDRKEFVKGGQELHHHPDTHASFEHREAFVHACLNRHVFLTTSGRLGVGPVRMEEGDLIAALWGCPAAVVLRRVAGTKSECTIVGVAYVYGIMEGEAVEAHEAAGGSGSVFLLR